jgi:transcriptional regulator
MSNKYVMDHDWLDNRIDAPATVRLTVSGANARAAVQAWFDELATDQLGVRGRGGWMVQEVTDVAKSTPDEVVVDITSGGEDVADSIEDATTDAFDLFDAMGFELTWVNRPRVESR